MSTQIFSKNVNIVLSKKEKRHLISDILVPPKTNCGIGRILFQRELDDNGKLNV